MTPPTLDAIRAALDCIPPDPPRDEWARVGMALKAELGEAGFVLFDAWSARGETYKAQSARSTWRSIKAGGAVGIGTLFHLAKEHGYRPSETEPAPKPTPEQVQASARERAERITRDLAEREARQREAAELAAQAWAQASDEGASPYLVRKGVKGYGVRYTPAGAVLVPLRDAAGELHNVQTIKPERPADGGPEKLFLKGGRKSGLWHWCGDPTDAPALLIGEGYATCASIHEATGRPVAVAFDAGNLAHVAKAIRKAHPAALIVLCADNDTATEAKTGTNPGRVKAQEAARAVRGACVWPEGLADGESDFNDLHQSAGLDAVRELIEAAIERGPQSARKGAQAPAPHPGPDDAPAGRKRAARGRSDDDEGDAPRFDLYRVEDGGLWFDPPDDGSGGNARPLRICGALHVIAWARDVNGNGAALLIECETIFETVRRRLMPLAMLAGDGTAYRADLAQMGFMAPTDAKRRALLTAYLQSRKPAELVRIVDRVGWHDAAGGGKVYVLPRETLGDDGGERVMFQSEAPTEGTFGQRGTLDQWRERIGRLCVGNSRLTFAASCAFAGPLLAWAADTDGRGVHLVGDSRSGKTTALRVAASIWGGRDYMQRWRASDNGLEGVAVQHSDALLCLDELAQLDAKVAGDAAYMLANGSGKVRGQRSGVGSRPVLTWRILFLSTGEIGLADHMAEANKRTRAGQELRMIDLPADAGAGCGVFERLHEHESGGALADALRLDVLRTYGTPGRAWLEHLTTNTEGLAHKLRERMAAIESEIVPDAASGQVRDAGRFFALVAVAGEMATADAKLTGWPEGEAIEAARRCFNAWIAARTGGIGLSEEAQILRQVREWFGTYGEMNFKRWGLTDSDHSPAVPMMAGWRKPVYGDEHNATGDLVQVEVGRIFYTLADKFRSTVCKGWPHRRALEVLKARDLLILEPSGRALHKARPPGESKDGADVYRIKSAILSASDEE